MFVGRSLVVVGLFVIACGSCGDEPKKRPVGGTCDGDDDCTSGLCYDQACMDPGRDDDGDGLLNGFEVGIATDPNDADSDRDGKRDPDELEVDLAIVDSDGDTAIDALESVLTDRDLDCAVDELDPDDLSFDGATSALVATLCPAVGVCGAPDATLAVHCPAGPATPACDFRQVPRHEAVESACDLLDNDCDGATDEGCALVFDGLVGHWPLDGDGVDVGPYGDDGELAGATAVADRFGAAGAALRFDGVDDRVAVAATHHPLGDVDVSYTAWVKPDRTGAGARRALVAFGEVLVGRRSALLLGATGCAEYDGATVDAAVAGAPTACAPAGHWSFLAVTKAGATVRFYLDARLQAEVTVDPGQDVRRTGLVIGAGRQLATGETLEPFAGALDDVRVYARVLSPGDLGALFADGGWSPAGTADNPGQSCRHVRDAAGATVDGATPLDTDGDGPTAPVTAWCDQTTDGGGWTLAWVYGFTAPSAFTAAANAVTPIPDWPAALADVPVASATPADPSTPGALAWDTWADIGVSFRVASPLVGDLACDAAAEGDGSFATGVEGPVVCRALGAPTCAPALPDWVFFWEYGPGLSAESLFYYFDGSTADNWPTHDPCGANAAPTGAPGAVGGTLWLR